MNHSVLSGVPASRKAAHSAVCSAPEPVTIYIFRMREGKTDQRLLIHSESSLSIFAQPRERRRFRNFVILIFDPEIRLTAQPYQALGMVLRGQPEITYLNVPVPHFGFFD